MEENLKQLLLKDLCARLYYGVKASDREEIITIRAYHPYGVIDDFGIMHNIENIKPYLLPMSSMTDEQKIRSIAIQDMGPSYYHLLIDRYNEWHLDYRGLIEKGLALDATGKDIY